MRGWLAGILAAALAAALAGVLTGWFGTLGRRVADAVAPSRSSASASAGSPADRPVTVAVQPYSVCLDGWVLPGEVSQLAGLPNADMSGSWRDWPPAAAGASAAPLDVLFYVQGTSAAEVIIADVRVRVLDRRPPPRPATLIESECGDPPGFRWLDVDLDQSPARAVPQFDAKTAREMVGEVPDRQLTPIRFPYDVSLSDAEPFLITARTEECTCTWVAELTWASQGRTGTIVIDDHGEPFRTASTRAVTGRCTVTPMELVCD